jgi:hypothetical protein
MLPSKQGIGQFNSTGTKKYKRNQHQLNNFGIRSTAEKKRFWKWSGLHVIMCVTEKQSERRIHTSIGR